MFRKSRLSATELLNRRGPGSGLRCGCSLFEVDLSAAELLDRVPPGSGGRNAFLPKLVDRRSYDRQMSDQHFGAFEHQPPSDMSAGRTHVDLALDDRHLHGVVPKHIHQQHLIVSRRPSTASQPPIRFRKLEREWPRGKPLHLRLVFNSAVRTSKPHRIGPNAGQGRVVNVKLKINRLSGFRAPTDEFTHRVAHKPQKKRAPCSQPSCGLVGFTARAKLGPNNLDTTGAAPRRRLSLSTVSMWRIRSPTTSI